MQTKSLQSRKQFDGQEGSLYFELTFIYKNGKEQVECEKKYSDLLNEQHIRIPPYISIYDKLIEENLYALFKKTYGNNHK